MIIIVVRGWRLSAAMKLDRAVSSLLHHISLGCVIARENNRNTNDTTAGLNVYIPLKVIEVKETPW